jgi:hypothetical protein
MKSFRVLALSAASIIGLSLTSAQAGEYFCRPCYRPVCPPPVVACAPAPCPVVTPAPVVCAPVVRQTYYRQAYHCGHRVVYRRHCR